MKNVLATKNLWSQAFQRYRGQGFFLNFCYLSAAGAPRQWWRNASYLIEKGVTLSAFYPNNTIISEDQGDKKDALFINSDIVEEKQGKNTSENYTPLD